MPDPTIEQTASTRCIVIDMRTAISVFILLAATAAFADEPPAVADSPLVALAKRTSSTKHKSRVPAITDATLAHSTIRSAPDQGSKSARATQPAYNAMTPPTSTTSQTPAPKTAAPAAQPADPHAPASSARYVPVVSSVVTSSPASTLNVTPASNTVALSAPSGTVQTTAPTSGVTMTPP
jgi:hypothetical protein